MWDFFFYQILFSGVKLKNVIVEVLTEIVIVVIITLDLIKRYLLVQAIYTTHWKVCHFFYNKLKNAFPNKMYMMLFIDNSGKCA